MKTTILFTVLFFSYSLWAQKIDTVIRWLDFYSAKKEFYAKPKPVLIFIDCDTSILVKKFKQTTFRNSEVVNYINALFYPVLLKASSIDTIEFFNGKKFTKDKQNNYHSLVYYLLGDRVEFPAIVIFDTRAVGRVFYGYKDRDHIFPILVYYAEKVYISTDYDIYQKYFLRAYPPGKKQIITHLNVKWLTMQQALEKLKTKPRKLFIDLYDNYNVSQTIMRILIYNNPVIARYLNTHFYPVTVYVRKDERFTINGKEYKLSEKYPYNTFAIDMLNGKMQFPAFVITDENFKILDREQVFMTEKQLEPILHYFGDDKYKQIEFQEFLKKFKSQLIEEH